MNNLARHIQPTTWAEATQLAQDISKSELVPESFRGKPNQILCAIQYGAEVGLSPFQALQSVKIIKGNASLSGDAMLALVSARPECEGVDETVTGKGDARQAKCEIRRRGWKKPVVCTFSVADAKQANLWGKRGPWPEYPDRMLQMRARGFAIRNAFQDALKGFISTEEAQDYQVQNSAPAAEAEVQEIAPFNAEESPAPPVVESTIEVPFTEETQSDPHPKDPDVRLITPAQQSGLENFVDAQGLDLDEVYAYLNGLGFDDLNRIPYDKVQAVVQGLAKFAKDKKAGGAANG